MKNNCDDLAMNYIISHFFNEFLPIVYEGNMKFLDSPISQSTGATHYDLRS
jgi:hypothetical protein